MPIAVTYGPISDALTLAQQAGKGQGRNIQAQRDLEALQLQNTMQSELDRNAASQIQQGIMQRQMEQQDQERQQQMAQQRAAQQAQLQLQNRTLQFNQERAGTEADLKQQQIDERAKASAAAQQTREDQAKSLAALRQAQIEAMSQPKEADSVRASGDALRSMDTEANNTQAQIKSLSAALLKAADPYTGDPEQAKAIREQINGLRFSLDGIDPSTGKKVKPGLNDKRSALRDTLQNMGHVLRPGATLIPNAQGGFDLNNNPGSEDPLYGVNSGASLQSFNQPGQAGPQQGQQPQRPANRMDIVQALHFAAKAMGKQSVDDTEVKDYARQILSQQGIAIPQ